MTLQDSDASGRDVLGLIKAQSDPAHAARSPWAPAEGIPALTRRIGELEARVRALEAELEAERRQRGADAVAERSMERALADVRVSIDAIRLEQQKVAEELESLRHSALGAVMPAAIAPAPTSLPMPTPAADDARALLDELMSAATERAQPAIELASPVTEVVVRPTAAAVSLGVVIDPGVHQLQVVISPIHSFPRLLAIERRISALASVARVQLRDFRNGVATFSVYVGEAISPAEFGAVLQMLGTLHLRLEGSTPSSVELRAEDEPPAS